MSTTVEGSELDAAIAAAELTDEEAARVRELVQEGGIAESAIAFVVGERETPDEDEEPPAPPAEPTGEPTKKQWEALAAENRRHEKRFNEIMGAFVAGFVACDACDGVGLVPPGPPPPRPQSHEWFIACETCQGFGEVLTGSLREGQQSRDCPACKGRGYLEALDAAGAALAPEASQLAAGTMPPPPVATPAEQADNGAAVTFGTPAWMGNPNLGA